MMRGEYGQRLRRCWAPPGLKLYGSVQALTAGGTGPTNETGMMSNGMGGPGPCYDGITLGGNMARKHCI
jgi:hypothetical protein